ncbi:MAG: glycoside hydrolase family 125 protein [Bacteroidota bacterium]|nr:glycoside hydrolase family 125 protein [Bacteroidota bacterium]
MKRREFLQNAGLVGAGLFLTNGLSFAQNTTFPVVRVASSKRHFTSQAIEGAIDEFDKNVKNRELSWLFSNCFPNTLDTTVFHEIKNGVPDTYVITGDIDAMWLRDSSAQVWPYINFAQKDEPLRLLIAGIINRQVYCVLRDPYANAFYNDPAKVGEWSTDLTDMKPGVHERKWEIDSLCYPIRLAYHYWKVTGDTQPFNDKWAEAVLLTYKVFCEQQRMEGLGPYKFQRTTAAATDTLPMNGYGYPVKPNGLICSSFRPSDDATVYSYLIPSNFFAVVSLKQAAEMFRVIRKDSANADKFLSLSSEVESALKKYAVIDYPGIGKIYAYEINGYGSYVLMDDANVPSLLSLPYLGALSDTDPIYVNTRKFVWSEHNPFYFKGKAADGIGGPHVGLDMVWPLSIIMKGLTSKNNSEIKECVRLLQATHGGTGFMHESFHKDNPAKFSRSWFAWANTIFGEFLWKVYKEKPELLA